MLAGTCIFSVSYFKVILISGFQMVYPWLVNTGRESLFAHMVDRNLTRDSGSLFGWVAALATRSRMVGLIPFNGDFF